MSVHQRAKATVLERPRRPFRRGARALAALALAACAAGCWVPPPAPSVGRDPSDPSARTRPVGYRSTTAGYQRQRPAEPAPWREQNQSVGPQP